MDIGFIIKEFFGSLPPFFSFEGFEIEIFHKELRQNLAQLSYQIIMNAPGLYFNPYFRFHKNLMV